MNSKKIIPAALAVALIAAGGVTQAFAGSDHGENHSYIPPYNATPTASAPAKVASAEPQASMPSAWPATKLSLAAVEKLAQQRVGGSVIHATRFGLGYRMYKIDLKSGDQMKRVFIDGNTGTLTVAASLDPTFDPSVIGNKSLGHAFHG